MSAAGFPPSGRSASTAIYYLLRSGQFSAFHRIKSDELWHFYAGSPLVLHVIEQGRLGTITLGRDHRSQTLQAAVKGGCWLAASVGGKRSYSLVGCTVAPGFDFEDWEMGDRNKLLKKYPKYRSTIEKYTR